MKEFFTDKRFYGALLALILVSLSYQNCAQTPQGDLSSSSGSVAKGPNGYSYSITMTPSPSTLSSPTTPVAASVSVAVSTAETMRINVGYYDISGNKIQSCSNTTNTTAATTVNCNISSFSNVTVASGSYQATLFVDVIDLSTGTVEVSCNSSSTAGCNGIFVLTSGGAGASATPSSYYICSAIDSVTKVNWVGQPAPTLYLAQASWVMTCSVNEYNQSRTNNCYSAVVNNTLQCVFQ